MLKENRCAWVTSDPLYLQYHDTEWGVPIYDDRLLFEFLILEGAQAGLSWLTVLKRRDNYRELFDFFDAKKIAAYDEKRFAQLMGNPGIIRNRLKIQSTINNAKAYLAVQKEFKGFSNYLWQFVNGKPLQNQWKTHAQIPVKTALSDALSRDLKKRGFNFCGSTICYAFMQAVGMVNDHLVSCFRHQVVQNR